MRITLEEMDEDQIDQLIRILGDSSATAKAKRMRDERKATGEDVRLFWDRARQTILVGPPLMRQEDHP